MLRAGKHRAVYFGYALKLCFELRHVVSGEAGSGRHIISGIGKLFVNQLSWAIEGFNLLCVHLNPSVTPWNKYCVKVFLCI